MAQGNASAPSCAWGPALQSRASPFGCRPSGCFQAELEVDGCCLRDKLLFSSASRHHSHTPDQIVWVAAWIFRRSSARKNRFVRIVGPLPTNRWPRCLSAVFANQAQDLYPVGRTGDGPLIPWRTSSPEGHQGGQAFGKRHPFLVSTGPVLTVARPGMVSPASFECATRPARQSLGREKIRLLLASRAPDLDPAKPLSPSLCQAANHSINAADVSPAPSIITRSPSLYHEPCFDRAFPGCPLSAPPGDILRNPPRG